MPVISARTADSVPWRVSSLAAVGVDERMEWMEGGRREKSGRRGRRRDHSRAPANNIPLPRTIHEVQYFHLQYFGLIYESSMPIRLCLTPARPPFHQASLRSRGQQLMCSLPCPLSIDHCHSVTFTFTFRAFSRRFHQKLRGQ